MGCGGAPASAPAPGPSDVSAPVAAPPRASCRPRQEAPARLPVATARQGSAVALARDGERLLAYAADADSDVIHVIDVDGGEQLARTALSGSPREVLALADGRLIVTLADVSRLAVLEPAADGDGLELLCEREVPAEPWGLASSPDGRKLAVTSGWASTLSIVDAVELETERVVRLARDPRSVLIDDDGRAWISHLVGGQLSVVDLPKGVDTPKLVDLGVYKMTPEAEDGDLRFKRTGAQGYALASVTRTLPRGTEAGALPRGVAPPAPPSTVPRATPKPRTRVLAPHVSVDPGGPSRRTAVYYGPPFDGVPKQAPMVSVIDPEYERPLTSYLLGTDRRQLAQECLLPRAAAARSATGSLYVACLGIDAVLELDAWALEPTRVERRRFAVPSGPTGIAIDEGSGRAVVLSQFEGVVTVLDLDGSAAPRSIAMRYEPRPEVAAHRAGRKLFYQTDDLRVANDGIACASCHPDGRDDAITWATPEGPRQTLSLAGRTVGTAPYGWVGQRGTLQSYIENTVARLGGRGMGEAELQDLTEFIRTVAPPPDTSVDAALASRGRDLFFDAEQGCATCHVGGVGSDGKTHAVAKYPMEEASAFDTPGLRGVHGSAPYFHDGRYATLEELLADPKSKMGGSAKLTPAERRAMAAFLRTL